MGRKRLREEVRVGEEITKERKGEGFVCMYVRVSALRVPLVWRSFSGGFPALLSVFFLLTYRVRTSDC